VRDDLDRLDGVQHALRIEVGDEHVPGHELTEADETGASERTASVHFIKFAFTDDQRDAFRDPDVAARLVVDHPAYAADEPIDGAVRLSLLADLALDLAQR
jgi:hypothetical protein